jgi:hypothetical protein
MQLTGSSVGCVSPLVHRIAAKTFPTVWQTGPKVETGPTLQGIEWSKTFLLPNKGKETLNIPSLKRIDF